MKAWLHHPMRVSGRLLWLGGEIVLAALNYVRVCAFRSKDAPPSARALWLHRSAIRALRIFRLEPQISGVIPRSGLLVCNHLSYLGILVLAACAPGVFVAKREVKSWPVFGWFARPAGTIFIDREKRTHVGQLAEEIERALNRGQLVILFPEGTSSDGQIVLPFKTSLLEPVTRQTHPLSADLIQYELDDGDVTEEVCYWKDMTLVPHLVSLLGTAKLVKPFMP